MIGGNPRLRPGGHLYSEETTRLMSARPDRPTPDNPTPPTRPRTVLLLARGDEERQQLEMMYPYCQRRGYQIVATSSDLSGALAMVEAGMADRIVMASRRYLTVPLESVTADIPTGPYLRSGDRPRRLR